MASVYAYLVPIFLRQKLRLCYYVHFSPNLMCTPCNASVLESFLVTLWDWTHDIGALYKCAMQNRLKVWRKSLEVWLGLESHEFLKFGFCMHIAFAKWVAQLQQVTGSSPEGEQKAHRHSCIATSALILCTGNHDLYVLVVLFLVIFVEISAWFLEISISLLRYWHRFHDEYLRYILS